VRLVSALATRCTDWLLDGFESAEVVVTAAPRTDWQVPPGWKRVEPLPMVDPDGVPLAGLDDDWTPGLLVLAWPELFIGDEDADRKQVEVAVLTLADAGRVDLYLAPVWGSSRRCLRIVARDVEGAPVSVDEATSISPSDVPWVWRAVLAEARVSRPGSYGERLFQWRGHTERAAVARGLMVPPRRDRFLARKATVDPVVVRASEIHATRLARWWSRFVAAQPDLYDALVRATGIPGAVA
jgi:hypothetical protein